MARTRTTKGVAQRIDLNYFKRATPQKRARVCLAIVAPAAALLWMGWHFFSGDQRVYSSGQLSEAHAVLEKQCGACHVQQTGGFSAKAADAACLACHDGPPHHPEAAGSAPQLTCAACHTEHRGAVKLSSVTARNCAACHGDLQMAGAGTLFAKNIRSFEDGHPEFAALRETAGAAPRDPGTIKLNHALHMKGIRRAPRGPTVQLECGDCHRPSASHDLEWKYGDKNYAAAMVSYTGTESFEPGGTRSLPTKQPWSDRQLMAPVKFANACAGCHLLTFDARFEEGVPHDRPAVVDDFLVKKFSTYISAHPNELREIEEPRRNLAGRANGPETRPVSPAQWVNQQVTVAEELLWHGSCAECHAVSATPLHDARMARIDAAGGRGGAGGSGGGLAPVEGKLPSIAAARTKLQWLAHARFDHDAHTGFACTGCHPGVLKSTQTSDILIPGIAVCQTCHAPGAGHASSECSECHTYHDWSNRKEVKPGFAVPGLAGRGGN